MVIVVREVQDLNDLFPIVVILFGIITEVRNLNPLNALSPIATVGYPPSIEGIEITAVTPVYFVIVANPSLII
jgi:hypothetical protein